MRIIPVNQSCGITFYYVLVNKNKVAGNFSLFCFLLRVYVKYSESLT